MPKFPPKLLLFYLIATFFTFFFKAGFCVQDELTEFQKQARIYREQGWQAQKEGNLDLALTYYQKAVVLDPVYAVAYNDIAIIFEAMGKLEQAKQMYLKATEVDPNYPNSYSNLALLYENEGNYANAILCWIKRATLGGPVDPWAEVARRRLEDIARLNPEVYNKIGSQ